MTPFHAEMEKQSFTRLDEYVGTLLPALRGSFFDEVFKASGKSIQLIDAPA